MNCLTRQIHLSTSISRPFITRHNVHDLHKRSEYVLTHYLLHLMLHFEFLITYFSCLIFCAMDKRSRMILGCASKTVQVA